MAYFRWNSFSRCRSSLSVFILFSQTSFTALTAPVQTTFVDMISPHCHRVTNFIKFWIAKSQMPSQKGPNCTRGGKKEIMYFGMFTEYCNDHKSLYLLNTFYVPKTIHFTCCVSLNNPLKNTMAWVLLLSLKYRWENWVLKKMGNLFKVTYLICGWGGNWCQVYFLCYYVIHNNEKLQLVHTSNNKNVFKNGYVK